MKAVTLARTPTFPDRVDRALAVAREMAAGYEERWEQPGYLDTIAERLPNFQAAFKEVLTGARLPANHEELQQLLLEAVVGGVAIGVATEALVKAGKLTP